MVVGVADHLIAHPAAQQIIDGNPQRFALDIPQRDIDGRYGRRQNPLGREKAPAVEGLPHMLNAPRVLTDEQRFEVFDGAHHSQFTARNAGFPDAINTLVGIDHYKQEVSLPTPYGIGFNICNLHVNSLPSF